MAITTISLGGLNDSQQSATNGGDYLLVVEVGASNPTLTFSGPSVFNLDGVTAAGAYAVQAINGAVLNVNGLAAAASTANLLVDDLSTITIGTGVSALSAINATFEGVGGTFSFAPGLLSLLTTVPTVTGFGPGSHLDFGVAFATGEQAVYSATSGVLNLETASGTVIGSVKLVGNYVPSAFTIGENSLGQAQIDLACFLRGTLILTPDGEVPVERLRAGDLVVTGAGQAVLIKAVRLRTFVGDQHGSGRAQPVCIMAGALAPDVPKRELYVSPDHSMYLGGVLVPASLLQNGQTIFQAMFGGRIDYFHIEVDPHAILIAEGAPTESYLDIGSRGHFARVNTITLLPLTDPKTWEDACAPMVLTGPKLDAIRMRLLARVPDCLNSAAPLGRVA